MYNNVTKIVHIIVVTLTTETMASKIFPDTNMLLKVKNSFEHFKIRVKLTNWRTIILVDVIHHDTILFLNRLVKNIVLFRVGADYNCNHNQL